MLTPLRSNDSPRTGKDARVALRKRIPADLETPVSVFLKLRSQGATFLLESVERGIQIGRYSFIGISPDTSIKLSNGSVDIEKAGDIHRQPVNEQDPFAAIRNELASGRDLISEDFPGPFGGAVGYISYDVARYFERVPIPEKGGSDLPDYHFLFPSTLAVFDHVKSEIEILSLLPGGAREEASAAARIDELLAALQTPLRHADGSQPGAAGTPPAANMTRESFQKKVLQAKEHILAGDAFQIVLSQSLSGQTDVPPFQIYRALRILNPSPYMFFIDFGDYQTIGSSPEMLVKLEKRQATLCPIAGTRPRGRTPTADKNLEKELLDNEKERAEHVMLVDLGRNDLGRVCETGTVAPESFMQVEKYSHVMHIVSRITGTLRNDVDMFGLLRATFPAGTVTGAPKIRAMELISELETDRRGPYAGAVGYFGRQGDMDLCITIRTILMRGKHYFVQAGAGIVADSDPAFEYQETLNKIEALTKAIRIAEEGL